MNKIAEVEHEPNWFDKPEQMKRFTVDLDGLHVLLNARHRMALVGNRREPILSEFVIGGSWFLDAFGQVGIIQPHSVRRGADRNHERVDITSLYKDSPILTKEAFVSFIGEGGNFSYSAGAHIPHNDTPCQHCGKYFTMEDGMVAVSTTESRVEPLEQYVGQHLKDVVEKWPRKDGKLWQGDYSIPLRNDRHVDMTLIDRYGRQEPINKGGWTQRKGTIVTPPFAVAIDYDHYIIEPGDEAGFTARSFYHPSCLVTRHTEEVINSVAIAFDLAGVECSGMLPIPNGYGSEEYRGEWLMIKTLKHGYFKVGWRKRVLMLRPVEVEQQSGRPLEFYNKVDTIERHFNDYKELGSYLKSKFNAQTDRQVNISLAKEVSVGGKGTGLHTWIGFTVPAHQTAIEDILTEHLGYDFQYSAINIGIGEPVPMRDWPRSWTEAHELIADGKVIGRINTSKLD